MLNARLCILPPIVVPVHWFNRLWFSASRIGPNTGVPQLILFIHCVVLTRPLVVRYYSEHSRHLIPIYYAQPNFMKRFRSHGSICILWFCVCCAVNANENVSLDCQSCVSFALVSVVKLVCIQIEASLAIAAVFECSKRILTNAFSMCPINNSRAWHKRWSHCKTTGGQLSQSIWITYSSMCFVCFRFHSTAINTVWMHRHSFDQ